jgi:hypothetical protein
MSVKLFLDAPKVAISSARSVVDSARDVLRTTSTASILFACAFAFLCFIAALRDVLTTAASTSSLMLLARTNCVKRPIREKGTIHDSFVQGSVGRLGEAYQDCGGGHRITRRRPPSLLDVLSKRSQPLPCSCQPCARDGGYH